MAMGILFLLIIMNFVSLLVSFMHNLLGFESITLLGLVSVYISTLRLAYMALGAPSYHHEFGLTAIILC